MSFDSYLEIDTGGKYPADVCVVGTYTSNVAWMWREALDRPLRDLDGANAGQAAQALTAALAVLAERADYFRANQPCDGWGSYEGALQYLTVLRDRCLEHPKTTVRIRQSTPPTTPTVCGQR